MYVHGRARQIPGRLIVEHALDTHVTGASECVRGPPTTGRDICLRGTTWANENCFAPTKRQFRRPKHVELVITLISRQ